MRLIVATLITLTSIAGAGAKPDGRAQISGAARFPGCFPPEDLEVCARRVDDGKLTCKLVKHGGMRYSLHLEPGRYTVFSRAPSFSPKPAYYSRAVLCGLSTRCDDHRPVVLKLTANDRRNSIDPADWFAKGHNAPAVALRPNP